MILGDVMQEVADRLDTIAGLRVFAYPTDQPPPIPAAIVSYPDSYTYDATYGRGMDRMELPVWLVVGKVSDRAARDQITKYLDGSGADSVKAVLESGTWTEFDTVRVMSVEFDVIRIGGIDYLAAGLTLDIAGQGA